MVESAQEIEWFVHLCKSNVAIDLDISDKPLKGACIVSRQYSSWSLGGRVTFIFTFTVISAKDELTRHAINIYSTCSHLVVAT